MSQATLSNPASKILVEHERLKSFRLDLRAFLSLSRPELGSDDWHTWSADLSRRLLELHELLFRHFRFEEREVHASQILQAHPEASGKLDSLYSEHPAILGEVRQLGALALEHSAEVPRENPFLRRRLTGLLDQLDLHENEETKLFQRLANRDLGAGH